MQQTKLDLANALKRKTIAREYLRWEIIHHRKKRNGKPLTHEERNRIRSEKAILDNKIKKLSIKLQNLR